MLMDCDFTCRMSEYAVVVFVAENSVECIPSAWLDVGKANVYWPLSVSRDKVIKYIKNKQHPDKSWHLFAVRIICYAGQWFGNHHL